MKEIQKLWATKPLVRRRGTATSARNIRWLSSIASRTPTESSNMHLYMHWILGGENRRELKPNNCMVQTLD